MGVHFIALPSLFSMGQPFQRPSTSLRHPDFEHAPVTHAKRSCVCAVASRGRPRVGSGSGAHSPWKRKAQSSARDEIVTKPGSWQTQPSFEQVSPWCHSFLSLSHVAKRTLNCVSIESAHCVIFSSTMHEQMRFWKKETFSGFDSFLSRSAAYSSDTRKLLHSSRRLLGSVRRSCSSKATLPSTLASLKSRTFLPPVVCDESYRQMRCAQSSKHVASSSRASLRRRRETFSSAPTSMRSSSSASILRRQSSRWRKMWRSERRVAAPPR